MGSQIGHNKRLVKETLSDNKGHSKDNQPQDNRSKLHAKKSNKKWKDTGKWCEIIPCTTLMNVIPNNCCWLRWKLQHLVLVRTLILSQIRENKLSTLNPMLPSLPQRSNKMNQRNSRKASISSTHRFGWRGLCYISLLIAVLEELDLNIGHQEVEAIDDVASSTTHH